MNIKEAREIKAAYQSRKQCQFSWDQFLSASGFLEGYEAGVREAAELQMRDHIPGDQLAVTKRCDHMDRRDMILKLLDTREEL